MPECEPNEHIRYLLIGLRFAERSFRIPAGVRNPKALKKRSPSIDSICGGTKSCAAEISCRRL